jgi:DNA invertase Pin-like site-specific DNA recombinase
VSTDYKEQNPENQLGPLRATAARLGWEVVEEIALEMSAWDSAAAAEVKRRAFEPIREGRADILCVWALDRICRGGIEAAFSLLAELEEHLGAAFYSLQEPFLSTAGSDRQTRELMVALLSWVAKWESQRKSERLKATVRTRRNRAAVINRRARWGGGSKGSSGGVLATLEDADRARQLRAQGATVRDIAAQLGLSKSQVGRLLLAR